MLYVEEGESGCGKVPDAFIRIKAAQTIQKYFFWKDRQIDWLLTLTMVDQSLQNR